ncbi:hypothetical protein [Rathayibacter toxicus]|uniref:hypothetical protein n=1 Tax=Rathayibacter toxicus TaxID=145458 RepID=UPI000CE773AC|nr:hypothetical protein [Rathayibacter toxicus]QOD11046.1 hypothetical protein BSG36_03570 [Rathayibacter toxicus]QWL27790.1 hypothetical protein E2R33_03580 [Rathayibacter toxicus]
MAGACSSQPSAGWALGAFLNERLVGGWLVAGLENTLLVISVTGSIGLSVAVTRSDKEIAVTAKEMLSTRCRPGSAAGT